MNVGRMSRQKGKRGEREAAAEWERLFRVSMRRSQQYAGSPEAGSQDIIGHKGVAIEVKRREKLNVASAIDQIVEDAPEGDVPLVLHRANNRPWLCTVRLDDLPQLVATLQHALHGQQECKSSTSSLADPSTDTSRPENGPVSPAT